MEVIYNI